MKFTTKYEPLMDVLSDISGVVDDSLSTDANKVVIFQFIRGEERNLVKLIGVSSYIVVRKILLPDQYTVEFKDDDPISGDAMFCQVKSKELLGFLGSYSRLRKTEVEQVSFEMKRPGEVECQVVEKERFSEDDIANLMYSEGGEERLNRRMISSYVLKCALPSPSSIARVTVPAPEVEGVPLQKEFVQLHTQNLLPLMQNTTTSYGYLMFDEEHVVAFSNAYIVVMKNRLADTGIFSGVRLQYRAVGFLDRLVSNEADVEAAKQDNYIYLHTLTTEAFVLFDTKLSVYQKQLQSVTKDNVVTLDRIYFKDVLKRLSLVNDSVEVAIKPSMGVVTLSNSKFSQDVDINYQRGFADRESLVFRIMPDVLNKAIIGEDEKFVVENAQFGGDVFIYYCNKDNNNLIVFSDCTDGWMSIARIKVS